MPCSDYREGDRERERNAWQAMELLCDWMRRCESQIGFDPGCELGLKLDVWWNEHKRLDALKEYSEHWRTHA